MHDQCYLLAVWVCLHSLIHNELRKELDEVSALRSFKVMQGR